MAEAPFCTAEGLFDRDDPNTLGLEPVRGEHRILYRASVDGYRFCHHPNLVEFEGELLAMWSNGREGEDQPGQRVLISRSRDGESWSDPVPLMEPASVNATHIAAGFHVAPDVLVAYFTVPVSGVHNLFHPNTALYATTSTDGLTWAEPRRVTSGFFIEGPTRLPDGRLLLGGETVGKAWTSHKARMRLLFTDDADGLDGWREGRIRLSNPRDFGYTEPNFFLRADGTLVAGFRNYTGHLFAGESHDNGETWTDPVTTNFADSTARFCFGALPDGSTYLVSNPGPERGSRRLLTIALSSDGRTFDRAWLLNSALTVPRFEGHAKVPGWQYAHALVRDGALHVIYSMNKEDVGLTRIPIEQFAAS